MTPADPVPAPLEANDPQRARALKAKIRGRVSDVRRHLLALRTAMAEFGDDFELDAFRMAYASEDPVELNRVKDYDRFSDTSDWLYLAVFISRKVGYLRVSSDV